MESNVTHVKVTLSPGQAVPSRRSVELSFGAGASSRFYIREYIDSEMLSKFIHEILILRPIH